MMATHDYIMIQNYDQGVVARYSSQLDQIVFAKVSIDEQTGFQISHKNDTLIFGFIPEGQAFSSDEIS